MNLAVFTVENEKEGDSSVMRAVDTAGVLG